MTLSNARQATLKQLSDKYVASMEANGSSLNYDKVATDRLLILEAINDWSGRTLGEDADVQLTHGGNDPCAATETELMELIDRMHKAPVILYPISGFTLGDDDTLRFQKKAATYRLIPHSGASRGAAVLIAETKHIRDVAAAMQLWSFCATEDCMAYLDIQMDTHGLFLEDEERSATRRIITSALQGDRSAGQIWNAMWRTVRDAAALSRRAYYNSAKAAKTIPKKIDKVLTASVGDPEFVPYDRISQTPLGAVLTLFLHRFGVTDTTTGTEVRERLAADAALAPAAEEDATDAEDGPETRRLVQGSLYFHQQFTDLDQLVLSCFKGMRTDTDKPEWDADHVLGSISYSTDDYYCFDGWAFATGLFERLKVSPPTSESVARNAEAAKALKASTGEWADESGWDDAIEEVLASAGMGAHESILIRLIIRYPAAPSEVARAMASVPLPSGLRAARVDSVEVYDEFMEKNNHLAVGNFEFSIPETHFEPDGADRDLVASVVNDDSEQLADLIATSVLRSIWCRSDAQKDQLLRLIGQKLQEHAAPRQGQDKP